MSVSLPSFSDSSFTIVLYVSCFNLQKFEKDQARYNWLLLLLKLAQPRQRPLPRSLVVAMVNWIF